MMMVIVTRMVLGSLLLGASAMAQGQLLGGRVGAGAGVSVPSMGGTVDGATRTTGDAVRSTVDAAPSVKVRAGASTRVDRGSRCYYEPGNYYYDPVYRDGYYYCEQRGGGGVAAGAAVSTPR